MIEGLHPYPEYKVSRLPWAPEIPSHWELVPNRALLKRRKALVGKEHVKFQLLSLTKGGVIVRDISTGKGKFSSDMGTSQEVRPGDFIFCLFDIPETPRTVGLSKHRGMITSAYTLFEPRNLSSVEARYLEQFYIAMDNRKLLSPLYSGLRNTIPPSRFLGAKTPRPSSDEQAAIVRFLDHANGKIERFIRAKRKLIGLLNEQKRFIINRAVTRGLDPHVPLKPSGIPWLGDIPKHWEAPLLGRFLSKIEQGWSPVAAEGALTDQQWCVLTLSSVRRGVFDPAAVKPIKASEVIPREIEVHNGDFLLTRSNTRERVGDVCIVEEARQRTLLCDLIYRLSLRKDALVPRFLMLQLLCYFGRGQIERDARGSSGTMPKISQGHIKSWRVLLPAIQEQKDIVATIARESEPINDAIVQAQRETALIEEYRTRLVADVVTGKLDVRAAAAKLPEISPEDLSAGEIPAGDEESDTGEADE